MRDWGGGIYRAQVFHAYSCVQDFFYHKKRDPFLDSHPQIPHLKLRVRKRRKEVGGEREAEGKRNSVCECVCVRERERARKEKKGEERREIERGKREIV